MGQTLFESELPGERAPLRGVVGVVVVAQRFLVIRRGPHVRAPGKICFPGGGLERGESETEALQRELHEELGVSVVPRQRIWECHTSNHVQLGWWQAELRANTCVRPCPLEVSSYDWVHAEALRGEQDLLATNRRFLDALGRGDFALDGI